VEEKALEVSEAAVWLVLTDRHVYMLEDGCDTRRFGDAPRPVVLRRYPLHSLQLLQIGFSFQSLLLGFSSAEKDGLGDGALGSSEAFGDSASSGGNGGFATGGFDRGSFVSGGLSSGGPRVFVTDGGSGQGASAPRPSSAGDASTERASPHLSHLLQAGGFVFLTRDKATTSSLVTEVASLAAVSRAKQRPPVLPEEVAVSHNDDAVLEALSLLGVTHARVLCPPLSLSRLGILLDVSPWTRASAPFPPPTR
jgi:hypothetical protein